MRSCEWGGLLAGMVSEELEEPYPDPDRVSARPLSAGVRSARRLVEHRRQRVGRHHLLGLAAPRRAASRRAWPTSCSPGGRQVARRLCHLRSGDDAGHHAWASGMHGFTLDREIGNFILTHPDLQVPRDTREFAINTSNARFWEPPVHRYVKECQAGKTGDARARFQHALDRLAGRGGASHPDARRGVHVSAGHQGPDQAGTPAAAVRSQSDQSARSSRPAAGPRPGSERVLEVKPEAVHQRVPLILGSRNEVERIERYHAEYDSGADRPYTRRSSTSAHCSAPRR